MKKTVFVDATWPSGGARDGRDLPAPDKAKIRAGTLIGGTYRVTCELGSGAMGLVLRAVDESLDRHVAIKFIHPALLDPDFRARFQDEARAMARVQHTNVVHIYAFGDHEGAPYFVMEYVEGTTLEAWLEANPLPDLGVAFRMIDDLCRGVTAIHDGNTVHRDLKPSNVLLDAQLCPRVADLGLAVIRRAAGQASNEIVGTPAYMAPEIATVVEDAEELRPRADVYSLACVAYQLLTGRLPFIAESNVGMLVQHAMSPAPPPSEFRAELSPAIDAAILHALEKDPTLRTATAEGFRRELMLGREGASEPLRILVAEDDEDFRSLMEQALGMEFPDAVLDCVADGPAALAAYDRARPSVAILDLDMPGLSGLEVTAKLRERDVSRTMPIIVLTGSGGPGEWRKLAELGADRFLVKPVVLDDVVELVRRLLGDRTSLLPRSR